MIWFLSGSFVFICIGFLYWFSNHVYKMVFRRTTNTLSFPSLKIENITLKDKHACFKEKERKAISIQSEDGIRLQGYTLEQETNNWILLVHDVHCTHNDMLDLSERFYTYGYNIAFIDLRGHGESGGKLTGFGIKDCDDVLLWCKYLQEHKSASSIILYGKGLGAFTCFQCLDKETTNITGIINEDCPISLHKHCKQQLKKQYPYLPVCFLMLCLQMACLYKNNLVLPRTSKGKYIKSSKVPIFSLCDKQSSKTSNVAYNEINYHLFDNSTNVGKQESYQ